MPDTEGGWFISDARARPTGPFTASRIIEALEGGGLAPDALCWRQGMVDWRPLVEVEPFATIVRSARMAAEPAASSGSENDRPLELRTLPSRGEHTSMTFIIGLMLVILASIGFAFGAFLPWLELRAPEFGQPAKIGALFQTLTTQRIAIFPLVCLPLALLSMFLPWQRWRGVALLGVALAAAITWFVVVRWLLTECVRLQLGWYVSACPPPPPMMATPSLMPWIMAAAIALVLAGAAFNTCRSAGGAVVVIAPSLAVGTFGFLHMNNWLRPSRPNPTLAWEITGPPSIGNPVTEATFTITNPSGPTFAVVPPECFAVTAIPGSLPGLWGRLPPPAHVLTLSLGRQADPGPMKRVDFKGVVRRPRTSIAGKIRFEPAWRPVCWRPDTQTGRWTLGLMDGARTILGETLLVDGVLHPDDARILSLKDECEKGTNRAKEALDDLDPKWRPGTTNPREHIRKCSEPLRTAEDAVEACRAYAEALNEMARLGEIDREDPRIQECLGDERRFPSTRIALINGKVDPETRDRIPQMDEQLREGKVAEAASTHKQLRNAVRSLPGELPALSQDIDRGVRDASIGLAEQLDQQGQYRDAVVLIVVPTTPNRDRFNEDLKDRGARVLPVAVRNEFRVKQVRLVDREGHVRPTWDYVPGLLNVYEWAESFVQPDLDEEDVDFDKIILKQHDPNYAPSLLRQDMDTYLKAHGMSPRTIEAKYWLAMTHLKAGNFHEAGDRFEEVWTQQPQIDKEGRYADLARLARCGELYAKTRTLADNAFIRAREDKAVVTCLEPFDNPPPEIMPPPVGLGWVDEISLIEQPEKLTAWLNGDKRTIPWVLLGRNDGDEQFKREFYQLVDLVERGEAVVWLSSDLILWFGDENQPPEPRSPPGRWKSGVATRISESPFYALVDQIGFDNEYKVLISEDDRTLTRKHPPSEPIFMIEDDFGKRWYVCVFWKCRHRGGRVAFLPSRVLDTEDGREFFAALYEASRRTLEHGG